MLEISQVSVEIDHKPIVQDFSWRFEEGAITCLIGPNGAGKSTLLRAIASVLPIKKGTIIAEGKDMAALSPRERAQKVSYLPQTMECAPRFSVSLFVRLAGEPWNGEWDKQWEAEHLNRCLDLCNIRKFQNRNASTLSGGERQRVYLAQVIYQNTPIVLLDEPNSFLDLKNIVLIENTLSRIKEEGRAVLLVTHDLQTVQRIGSQVVAMKDGQIHIADTPEAVLRPSVIADLFELDSNAVRERFGADLKSNGES